MAIRVSYFWSGIQESYLENAESELVLIRDDLLMKVSSPEKSWQQSADGLPSQRVASKRQ